MLVPFNYQGSKLKEITKLSNFIKPDSKIIEPFFGSGIVTMKLGAKPCAMNDLNKDLVEVWKWCTHFEFVNQIREYCQENNRYKEYYYARREEYNELWKKDEWSINRAALFYYLMNSCHAGLIRYGPNGFNTSMKIYLLQGRKYNIEERIESLRYIKSKLTHIENNTAIDFLKNNEKDLKYFDVIYCDPPYIDSASKYIDQWNNNDLKELDLFLDYTYKKYEIKSVLSNYHSENIEYKGHTNRHKTIRQAGTSLSFKEDVIITYGMNHKIGIENFYAE